MSEAVQRPLALRWRFMRGYLRSLPVNRISLVKPEKARAVEDHLIRMARSGKLKGEQLSDARLSEMLESMAEKEAGTKVVIKRRTFDDSDSEDNDDDL